MHKLLSLLLLFTIFNTALCASDSSYEQRTRVTTSRLSADEQADVRRMIAEHTQDRENLTEEEVEEILNWSELFKGIASPEYRTGTISAIVRTSREKRTHI